VNPSRIFRIVFDLQHPAHVNFFRKAIEVLVSEGHRVEVTVLRRGKLPAIAQRELSGLVPVTPIGRHRGTTWSILWEANVMKFVTLIGYVFSKKPDIGLSVGSFTLGAAMKLRGKPNIQFDDDPERPKNVALEQLTATEVYFPPITHQRGNIRTYNALKEWAYLSPTYFKPNADAVRRAGLEPGAYIFVREVSTGSLNYQGQAAGAVASFAKDFPEGVPVVLSLEDKPTRPAYPEHWQMIQEPVEDIHSILYYARAVVSSGDSMAREGAMLGVPALYVGFREMAANALLERESILFKAEPQDAAPVLAKLVDRTQPNLPTQAGLRDKLLHEWIDVSAFILNRIRTLLGIPSPIQLPNTPPSNQATKPLETHQTSPNHTTTQPQTLQSAPTP
jgi:hypothetical protein